MVAACGLLTRWSGSSSHSSRAGRDGLLGYPQRSQMRMQRWGGSTCGGMNVYVVSGTQITVVSKVINLSHIHLITKGNQLQEKKYMGQLVKLDK